MKVIYLANSKQVCKNTAMNNHNPENQEGRRAGPLLSGVAWLAALGCAAAGLANFNKTGNIGANARLSYEQDYLGPEGCLTGTPYEAIEDAAAYYPMSKSLRIDPGEFGGDVLKFAVDDAYQLTPADKLTEHVLEDRDC